MRRLWFVPLLAATVGCTKAVPTPAPPTPTTTAPVSTAPVSTDPVTPTIAPSPRPAPPSPEDAADRAEAKNRLKMIGLTMHNYEGAMQRFPAGIVSQSGTPGLSWRVALLPYLGEDALHKQFKLNEAWDSEHNKPLVARMPTVFQSPGKAASPGRTHFVSIRGQHTFLPPVPPNNSNRPPGQPGPPFRGRGILDIHDGTSNSLMVVEGADPVVWTKPEDVAYNGLPLGMKGPPALLPKLGGPFADGFHGLMADGAVHFFPKALSESTLRAMLTINGARSTART